MEIAQGSNSYFKSFFQKITKSKIFFLLILTLTVFLIYGKAINYEFLNLDDTKLISGNINFISDIRNLPRIFVTGCYYTKNSDDSYYRPILSLSFVLESLLFGENSKVSHTTNIILFILSIYLMYVFLLKFDLNKFVLQFVILLIAVHPILTSVPVWIAGRNDSLLTIFSILSFINILGYSRNNKLENLIFSVFFFAMSLFTKESAMVLLLVVPILMLSVDKFNIRKLLNIYFGFLLCIFLYFFLRSFAHINNSLIILLKGYMAFFKNMIYGCIIYISAFLMPTDIPVCLFNCTPNFFDILKTIILVVLVIFIYYKKFISRKIVFLGISLFLLYLVPTFFKLQLFFHRLLLPSLGLVLIAVFLIQKITEKYLKLKKYFLCSFIILFLFFSYNSYLQANKYRNNEVFSVEGYKNAPTYHVFLNNIGNLYSDRHNYEKALEFKLLAEKYAPGYYLTDISSILCYQKKFDEAEEILERTMTINKQKEFAYANLSLIYEEKNDYKKSLEYAKKAYEENPYNIELSINLARKYSLNSRYQEAIDIYLKLLRLNKKQASYYYSIGFLYDKIHDKEKSLEYIKEAVQLDKDNKKYKDFLSNLLKN